MNIFRVLEQGGSSVREVNMSALLAYFLEPREDHGLRDVFLREFLDILDAGISIQGIKPDISIVEPEFALAGKNIDIAIILHDHQERPVHRVLIENKIKENAADIGQLQDYYDIARQDMYGDLPITMVFLTPPPFDKYCEKANFNALAVRDKDSKVHLHWVDGQDGHTSIQNIIRNKILEPESKGNISPIGDYVKHTLKAFAMHLQAMYERHVRRLSGARASPVPASDADGGISFDIDGYEVVKNTKGYVFVRKDGDRVVAKPVLREINEKYKLGVDKHGLNTHQLGARIIKAWQARCAGDA